MDELHDRKRTREVYSYTKCGKRYTKKKVLKKHVVSAHSAAQRVHLAIYTKYMTTMKERSRIVCRVCAITLGSNSEFWQHQRRKHSRPHDVIFRPTDDYFLLVDKIKNATLQRTSSFVTTVTCPLSPIGS